MKLEKLKINEVAEEITSCVTETNFTLAWCVIQMHHFIGKILTDNFSDNLAEILPTLASKTKRSPRSLYRSARFYKHFPDLDSIPGGKSASFNRLEKQFLIESGEKEPCKHEEIIRICKNCHEKI